MTSRDLNDDEYAELARFRHRIRAFLAFSEQAARDHDIAPAQHQLLLAVRGLDALGTPATAGAVAELLVTKLNSTVELIDRCAANGYVTRRNDPDDRRRSLIALTRRGHAKLAELSAIHRTEVDRFRNEVARDDR